MPYTEPTEPTAEMLQEDQQRISNIHRILDFNDAYTREKGSDPHQMDRKIMQEEMYLFSMEAGIPEEHFRQAYAHLISELNGTPSQFLQPIFNQTPHIMKTPVEPLLPPEVMREQRQQKSPNEPTTRSGQPRPYFSPMMERSFKK